MTQWSTLSTRWWAWRSPFNDDWRLRSKLSPYITAREIYVLKLVSFEPEVWVVTGLIKKSASRKLKAAFAKRFQDRTFKSTRAVYYALSRWEQWSKSN